MRVIGTKEVRKRRVVEGRSCGWETVSSVGRGRGDRTDEYDVALPVHRLHRRSRRSQLATVV
jgi:hypothetical protein